MADGTKAERPIKRAILSVGSNMGNRFQNIERALSLLCQSNLAVSSTYPQGSSQHYNNAQSQKWSLAATGSVGCLRTSFLYQTAPMYQIHQPAFLNGAVLLETTLDPVQLLHRIKQVEALMGRDLLNGERNGPRPVDLDILFYLEQVEEHTNEDNSSDAGPSLSSALWRHRVMSIEDPCLEIPHPRLQEREFVLVPLLEVVDPQMMHPTLGKSVHVLWDELNESKTQQNQETPREVGHAAVATRVLPLPRNRLLLWNATRIMGIVNVTPDSFSDGGAVSNCDDAVKRALEMVQEGADIVDVGGESTRPGAKEVSVEEELQRTIPAILGIRQHSDIPISIDTRRSVVARAAVEAGADLVNDVSGGTFDPHMLNTVGQLGVPVVLMHMRGTPGTMQTLTRYDDVVSDVAQSLEERCQAAERHGVYRWRLLVDPGIGFAKDLQGNLSLLRNLAGVRAVTGNPPVLLGTSRKGFLGKLTGVSLPKDRDPATIASCVAAICLEESDFTERGTLFRVHNVSAAKQAVVVMDAIRGVHYEGKLLS